MRVCDLTTLFIDGGQGGVNTYLHEKARFLTRHGHAHTVIVPGAEDSTRRLFGSTVHTLRSRPLPSNPAHRVLARFREVRKLLRAFAPDVVEVDCAYLLGQVASKVLPADVPVVGFYHVHLPTFIARPRFSRFGPLAGAAERFTWRYVDYCYRHVDRLVVTSHDMEARLAAAGFERLEHIPLGVNLDLFQPNGRDARDPERPVELLSVGRLSREKDLPTLFDAFSLLPADYRLTVVGDGPLRNVLEERAARDPRVRMLGPLPYGSELAKIYAGADMLVVPSPNETFNLTVLEGFASGLPVVAARQGGPLHLVPGELGELATPGDPMDFARKIQSLAARRVPSSTCRALAVSRYSWEGTFERLVGLYERARSEKASLRR
ncbi:MAG: glycosyltransferase family 1 protein [Planctomycetota bacterium]|nr:MAG: glycosyltransferase family 1 protein [Planctomycetota bacterium]